METAKAIALKTIFKAGVEVASLLGSGINGNNAKAAGASPGRSGVKSLPY